jgi:hypothetical protein
MFALMHIHPFGMGKYNVDRSASSTGAREYLA